MSLIGLPTRQIGALEGRVILINGAQGGLGELMAGVAALQAVGRMAKKYMIGLPGVASPGYFLARPDVFID